jgi:hypothetical protein
MQLKIVEIFDKKELCRLRGMTYGCTNADFTCSVDKVHSFFYIGDKARSSCGREN